VRKEPLTCSLGDWLWAVDFLAEWFQDEQWLMAEEEKVDYGFFFRRADAMELNVVIHSPLQKRGKIFLELF